jgi:hypothetical protein
VINVAFLNEQVYSRIIKNIPKKLKDILKHQNILGEFWKIFFGYLSKPTKSSKLSFKKM